SADGKVLASGAGDGSIIVWSLDEGKVKQTFKGHNGPVQCLAFVPSSPLLSSGGADGGIRFWNTATGNQFGQAEGIHPGGVTALAFFPQSLYYATSGRDLTVKTWKLETSGPRLMRTFRSHGQPVTAIGANAKLGYLATGGLDGTVKIFDPLH